jgi:hypothetical protein
MELAATPVERLRRSIYFRPNTFVRALHLGSDTSPVAVKVA